MASTCSKRKSLAVDDKIDVLLVVEKERRKQMSRLALLCLQTHCQLGSKIRTKYFPLKTAVIQLQMTKVIQLCGHYFCGFNFVDLKQALFQWFKQARTNAIAISSPLLSMQTKKFCRRCRNH